MRMIPRWATLWVVAGIVGLCATEGAAPQTAPQTSSEDGLKLLHKMQSALGGAKKIAAIRDYEEIVNAQIWNSAGVPLGEVRKRTRWMRSPNVLRLDQRGPRDTYVLYFDGASGTGWEILPDLKSAETFKTTGEAIELAGGELRFASGYLSGFQFNMWLADRMPGFTISSPRANVLRMERGGTAEEITLDATTGLPVKTAGISLADPDRPVSSEMRYEAWTETGGIRFPTKRANYHNGVKLAEETTEERIRVNAGLRPQDLAAKPANFEPEIPRRE